MSGPVDVLNRFESMLGWQQTRFILDVVDLMEASEDLESFAVEVPADIRARFASALARCKGEGQ